MTFEIWVVESIRSPLSESKTRLQNPFTIMFRMWWINLRETIYISMMMVTRTIFSHLATNNSRKMILVLTNPHYIFGMEQVASHFPHYNDSHLEAKSFLDRPKSYPIGSMYGIYANIWGILMGSMLPYMAAPWILWVLVAIPIYPHDIPGLLDIPIAVSNIPISSPGSCWRDYRKPRSSEWKTTLFVDVPLNQSIYP